MTKSTWRCLVAWFVCIVCAVHAETSPLLDAIAAKEPAAGVIRFEVTRDPNSASGVQERFPALTSEPKGPLTIEYTWTSRTVFDARFFDGEDSIGRIHSDGTFIVLNDQTAWDIAYLRSPSTESFDEYFDLLQAHSILSVLVWPHVYPASQNESVWAPSFWSGAQVGEKSVGADPSSNRSVISRGPNRFGLRQKWIVEESKVLRVREFVERPQLTLSSEYDYRGFTPQPNGSTFAYEMRYKFVETENHPGIELTSRVLSADLVSISHIPSVDPNSIQTIYRAGGPAMSMQMVYLSDLLRIAQGPGGFWMISIAAMAFAYILARNRRLARRKNRPED